MRVCSFATNLEIELEKKVNIQQKYPSQCSIEKPLKMLTELLLNLPVKTTSEGVHF